MEKQEIIDAIEYVKKYKTETNRIEVKKALDGFPKCYDTFSSFSNKYGGIIIFGIDEQEDFKITGVYDINDLQKKISSLCNDSMEPIIRPDIVPIEYEGKKLVAVKIEEISQDKKPCYYKLKGLKGGSYTRIGDSDSLMTDYEIYALQSYKEHIFEDIRPNKRASLEDLNEELLKMYIIKLQLEKPNFAKNNYIKCLKLSGIVDTSEDNIYPTLAGTLIFSDYPQSFYPQLFIACSVIPGTKLGDVGLFGERFLDNKRVEGTIEEMLEGAINFLQRNMKKSVIINSDGKRIDRTEYPIEALREAIANALIHRDYSAKTENAYISVYMFSDRIEIINPGALYGTNKIEKLGELTTLEARNTTMVRILEEKESVVENRHSGIPTMIREMKNYGLPAPEFYEERDSFKVIFRNTNVVGGQQIKKQSGQQIGNTNRQHKSATQISNTNQQRSGQQIKKTSGQQIEPQKAVNHYKEIVLDYCKISRTAKEIKEYLNINSRQYISTHIIQPLINEGKLNYTNKNSVNAKNQKYIAVQNKS